MQEILGLVSVIIPTQNRSGYLKKAIQSVLQQNHQNIEIIIIANGCTDATTKTVTAIKRTSQLSILYFDIAEKIGAAKARNIGINHASGEYIAFLDDDDLWLPHTLTSHITQLAKGKHCITSANCIYIYGDQEKEYKRSKISDPKTYILQDIYYENSLRGFSFCATKRKYLHNNRINESINALQDWDLWLKIIKSSGLPAYKENRTHSIYLRIGHQRISSNQKTVLQAQKNFLQHWQSQIPQSAINYHQMRIACLTLKTKNIWHNKKPYLSLLSTIIKTIATSAERYNLKRYIHYIMLPITNISEAKFRIWRSVNR